MKNYDVVSVCNALVDILFDATDEDLYKHNFTKGNMHLVDRKAQETLLNDFKGKEKAVELGGSSLNAMRALAMLKKDIGFAGMIANDVFGKKIQDKMDQLKIDANLHHTDKEATGVCTVLVTPDGERTMVTYLGASRLYNEEHIPKDQITAAKYFHFCGYQWDTDGQKIAIQKAVQHAENSKTLVSFDLADPFVVQHHKEDFKNLISKHVDIVFANKEEARLLYGMNPEETAKKIADQGPVAVIKLGGEGALICKKGEEIKYVEPVETKVIDTTAAGDMFAAGFLYGLCSEKTLEECGKLASSLASDVISRYGAILSDNVIEKVKQG